MIQVRLIHPTTRKYHTASVSGSLTVAEVAFQLCKEFELHHIDIDTQQLVLSASSERTGNTLPPTSRLDAVLPPNYKPDKDSFEFQTRPVYVNVSVSDGGPVPLETRRILLDFNAPLNIYYSHFQACCTKLGSQEFVFQAVSTTHADWINSNKTLADSGFDPKSQYLVLYPVKEVYKRFQLLNEVPEKSGFLWKQSGPDIEKVDKSREKRWCILTKIFLIYFKNKGDKEPMKVIPLDFHILKKKRDDKNHYTISLRRVTEAFFVPKGTAQVYIFSTDDYKEDINEWYDAMAHKCINTGDRRVFGAPLSQCFAKRRDNRRVMPIILTKTIGWLDQRGLDVEGIFRLNGSMSAIDQLRDAFDLGLEVDLTNVNDPHVVASLLKQWLRELPEPLLTFGLYDSFILVAENKAASTEEKVAKLVNLVKSLPEANQVVLKYLLAFLNRVSRLSEINKMTLQNLGTCFGPNLLRPQEENVMRLVRDTPLVNEVIQMLIENEAKINVEVPEKPRDPNPTPSDTVRDTVSSSSSAPQLNLPNNPRYSVRLPSGLSSSLPARPTVSSPAKTAPSPAPFKRNTPVATSEAAAQPSADKPSTDSDQSGLGIGAVASAVDMMPNLNSIVPIWKRAPLKEGLVQVKPADKSLFTDKWAVLTSTTLYFFSGSKGKSAGQPSSLVSLKGSNIVRLESKRFRIESAVSQPYVISLKSEKDTDEWIAAIETVLKRLSTPKAISDHEVLEGAKEEQQWTQVVRMRKQEKRVTRYLSQIELLENKLSLEIAARQALEQHVRGLIQRINALEQKVASLTGGSGTV